MLIVRLLAIGVAVGVGLTMPSGATERSIPRSASQTTRDCADCPEIVAVPGARDGGGPLWVAVNETTWAEYLASVRDGVCEPPHLMNATPFATKQNIVRLLASSNYAVVGVSFEKIKCYAAWLSSKKGRHYRLPTETEWERFARAGVSTQFPWGEKILPEKAALRLHTKLKGNGLLGIGSNNYDGLPVRSFPPNSAGIYDVIGNSFELTSSCRQRQMKNFSIEDKIKNKCHFIIRGGSYNWTSDEDTGLSKKMSVSANPEMNDASFRLVAE